MSSSAAHLTTYNTRQPAPARRGWVILGLAIGSWVVVGTIGYGVVQLASILIA